MRFSALLLAGMATTGVVAVQEARAGATVDAIKAKDFVQCGVNVSGLPGFAEVDSANNWSGLDVDLCRAVAAALLGDATKVKYTPLNAKERFTALQSGEIDVLSRNTTWTSSRDSALGLDFAGVNYYDGQGFMAKKELGVDSALRARRRLGLRAGRHHHRAQPRRLLPRQQHDLQAGRVREQRRGQQGLRGRPLRRADHRPVGPLLRPG